MAPVLMAGGAGTSGGLTLIESYGARPSALGEAFTAVTNDIAAFGYNPAALNTLETGQASFMYQKGLSEDAFGQFLIGSPMSKGSLGLSIGYYNGGELQLFDGTQERTVTAQRDLAVGLGFSRTVGSVSLGITGKYLSSELIETEKATAFAADFGLNMPLTSRIQVGAAVQNIGTELKFIDEGDELPRIARAGMTYGMPMGSFNTMLMLDAPYYMNEAEVRPSVGLEVGYGVLAIRAGYKSGSDVEEFSIGTGFLMGRTSFDYSFGMVQDLDSQHRVSLSMKFGADGMGNSPEFVRKENDDRRLAKKIEREERRALREEKRQQKREVVEVEKEAPAYQAASSGRHQLGQLSSNASFSKAKPRRLYTVRAGDNLATIAERVYGNAGLWKNIYNANRHLIDDPTEVAVGQRIILP